jgi:hypothetical protein
MLAFLSDFLASVVPTFLASRLLLWTTTPWADSLVRLVVVHTVSLGLCVLVGTVVLTGGGGREPFVGAFALFVPGALAWFLVDAFRLVLHRRETTE